MYWLFYRWLYVRCYIKEVVWRVGVGGFWVYLGNFNIVSFMFIANGFRFFRSWILEVMFWKDIISSSFYNKKFLCDYKDNLESICIDDEYFFYFGDVFYLEIFTCNRLIKIFDIYVSYCEEFLFIGLVLFCFWKI